jgi:hypothetical protein
MKLPGFLPQRRLNKYASLFESNFSRENRTFSHFTSLSRIRAIRIPSSYSPFTIFPMHQYTKLLIHQPPTVNHPPPDQKFGIIVPNIFFKSRRITRRPPAKRAPPRAHLHCTVRTSSRCIFGSAVQVSQSASIRAFRVPSGEATSSCHRPHLHRTAFGAVQVCRRHKYPTPPSTFESRFESNFPRENYSNLVLNRELLAAGRRTCPAFRL